MYPKKYVPKNLSKKDKSKQKKMLKRSKRLYKRGRYYEREKVKSFKSKKSPHIKKAEKIYKIDSVKAPFPGPISTTFLFLIFKIFTILLIIFKSIK